VIRIGIPQHACNANKVGGFVPGICAATCGKDQIIEASAFACYKSAMDTACLQQQGQ